MAAILCAQTGAAGAIDILTYRHTYATGSPRSIYPFPEKEPGHLLIQGITTRGLAGMIEVTLDPVYSPGPPDQ